MSHWDQPRPSPSLNAVERISVYPDQKLFLASCDALLLFFILLYFIIAFERMPPTSDLNSQMRLGSSTHEIEQRRRWCVCPKDRLPSQMRVVQKCRGCQSVRKQQQLRHPSLSRFSRCQLILIIVASAPASHAPSTFLDHHSQHHRNTLFAIHDEASRSHSGSLNLFPTNC